MNEWLYKNLICPRDHNKLQLSGNALVCGNGHSYPYVDGVAVILVDDIAPTLQNTEETLKTAKLLSFEPKDNCSNDNLAPDQVHPYVQEAVAGTCGNLYTPLINKLTRYPIPELRLPEGNGQILLDIGCNWGRWSIAAARKGYRPIGIDTSIEGVMAARKICQQLGVEAEFLVADARYLPFPSAIFDVVFSYSVLQHFSKENVKLALGEASRVLKIDGTCLIQMPNILGIRSLHHQLKRYFRNATDFDVRYWNLPELKKTFTEFIGDTFFFVDGYFGLGIQKTDIDLLPSKYRAIVRCSEILRRLSEQAKWMQMFADSVYVKSTKKIQQA
jgi:ubiquinone/menaquinone biosynthesis C-methylase UbiE/uncharacterized protein YbaR (Trm112 family)